MSSRKSYSIEFKLKTVAEAKGKNILNFCKQKNIDVRMFYRWKKKSDQLALLKEHGHGEKRSCGSGRRAEYPELEDLLYDWVVYRRLMSYVVRRVDIHNMALELFCEFGLPPEKFKASTHWVDNFLQRHHLSLRRSTTLFKLVDEEIVKRAICFKSFVDRTDFSQYDLSNMVAMDETAVYMGETSQITIEHTGASSIYVPSTGYESSRVTCILAIRLDGTKVTPFLISKGKKNKIEKISGIYVIETVKAWATQEVIRKWVCAILPRLPRGNKRGLLAWDSASTHRATDMKKFLAQQRIDQIMVPAGTTAYLQSLDLVINKPFKDFLRTERNDYIEHRMVRNERGNYVKPPLQEVVNWVRKAWDKVTNEMVAKALQAGYLDKKASFAQSSIAKHERLGPLILQALESQTNIVIDDNNNNNNEADVLEEDDVDAVVDE